MAKRGRRGRGEGTIFLRKDGRWVAEITTDEGKRKSLYGKTQEEVIKKLQQAQFEKKQGILATGPRQKFGDHMQWWFEEVHKQNLRESSYIRYQQVLKVHILPAFKDMQLQAITTKKIQAFFNQKAGEGFSASSIQHMNTLLNQSLEYAVKTHLISYNPCASVSLPKKRKKSGKKRQVLTLEQAKHLLKVAQGHPLEAFITLALATGMRHGELTALRWGDIDFEKEWVYVHRTVKYEGKTPSGKKAHFIENEAKTESSERLIPISPSVVESLMAHKRRQMEQRLKAGKEWAGMDLVFCTRTGGFLIGINVRAQFYRLLTKAGLPKIHIHALRHTASTLFRSMGVDPKVIQEILGHSSIEMTMNVYSHVLPSMQIEAARRIETLFQG